MIYTFYFVYKCYFEPPQFLHNVPTKLVAGWKGTMKGVGFPQELFFRRLHWLKSGHPVDIIDILQQKTGEFERPQQEKAILRWKSPPFFNRIHTSTFLGKVASPFLEGLKPGWNSKFARGKTGGWEILSFWFLGPGLVSRGIFAVCFRECTPPKFNMEPENDDFRKESRFPGVDFQVPC